MIAGRLQRFIGKRVASGALVSAWRIALADSEFVVVSVILQAGFALPMAYYFHRATIVSLPANILAVPLTEVVVVAEIVAVAFSYISLALAKIPVFVANIAMAGIAQCVQGLGALRIADTRVATPLLMVILVSVLALVVAMILARADGHSWPGRPNNSGG